jgi:hypothetical protein
MNSKPAAESGGSAAAEQLWRTLQQARMEMSRKRKADLEDAGYRMCQWPCSNRLHHDDPL